MMWRSSLVCVGVLLVFGCSYQFKDRYINPVSPPPSTLQVSIDIEDPNFKSPFSLVTTTTFAFDVDGTTKKIVAIKVLVDGNELTNVTNTVNRISFTLDPASMNDGNHSVSMFVDIDTESGSLADQLGGEFYQLDKAFTVVVDKIPPTYSGSPIAFAIENGALTLTWTKADKQNFYYKIVHTGNNANTQNNLSGDTTIYDPTINKFIDYGYLGGPISYKIYAIASNGTNELVDGNYNTRTINIHVSAAATGVENLSWSGGELNTSNVSISLQGTGWNQNGLFSLGTATGGKPMLGDADRITVSMKRNGYSSYSYDTVIAFTPASNFQQFSFLKSTESGKLVTTRAGAYLTRVDLQSLAREDSITWGAPTNVVISADGTMGLVYDHYSPSSSVYIFDPDDFSQPHTGYYLEYVGPYNGGQITSFYTPKGIGSVSDTRMGGINYQVYIDPVNFYNPTNTAAIWDFTTGKALWADTTNADAPVISADANYFVANNQAATENWVYKNNAGSWSFIGKVPLGTRIFRNHGTAELIVASPSSLNVYDFTQLPDQNGNFAAVRSFALSQTPNVIDYDPASDNISLEYLGALSYNAALATYLQLSTINVYGIQNFDFKIAAEAMVVAAVNNQTTTQHKYAGGYHFLSSGYAEKIN